MNPHGQNPIQIKTLGGIEQRKNSQISLANSLDKNSFYQPNQRRPSMNNSSVIYNTMKKSSSSLNNMTHHTANFQVNTSSNNASFEDLENIINNDQSILRKQIRRNTK